MGINQLKTSQNPSPVAPALPMPLSAWSREKSHSLEDKAAPDAAADSFCSAGIVKLKYCRKGRGRQGTSWHCMHRMPPHRAEGEWAQLAVNAVQHWLSPAAELCLVHQNCPFLMFFKTFCPSSFLHFVLRYRPWNLKAWKLSSARLYFLLISNWERRWGSDPECILPKNHMYW